MVEGGIFEGVEERRGEGARSGWMINRDGGVLEFKEGWRTCGWSLGVVDAYGGGGR